MKSPETKRNVIQLSLDNFKKIIRIEGFATRNTDKKETGTVTITTPDPVKDWKLK